MAIVGFVLVPVVVVVVVVVVQVQISYYECVLVGKQLPRTAANKQRDECRVPKCIRLFLNLE